MKEFLLKNNRWVAIILLITIMLLFIIVRANLIIESLKMLQAVCIFIIIFIFLRPAIHKLSDKDGIYQPSKAFTIIFVASMIILTVTTVFITVSKFFKIF